MKKILGCIRRADQDFSMIQEGDRIAVGISGGKDSLTLLKALRLYQYFSKTPFQLEAITLTMGLEPFDLSGVERLCADLEIPYTVRHTKIGKIIFEERKEKNPCSLCANMRRGALHNVASELGCNKVALGHHREDVIETFFLSLFYEGRLNTFSPVTYLTRKKITLIRPMVYVPEKEIISYAKKEELPVVHNPCPANGFTKRQYMKDLMASLSRDIPRVKEQVIGALRNKKQYNLWDKYM